jgi:PDZ domain-containing protein/aspartyl protease
MKSLAITVCLFLTVVASPLRGEKPAPKKGSDPQKPVAVKFELLSTKHMVLQIKINGKGPYRVIFDTGAPVSLINTKTAKESGLLTKKTPRPAFNLFGPIVQTNIQKLEIGDLKSESIPVIVMDHPTVQVISEVLGPVEGIIGFPFFARYKMTLDYQAKELTFVPSGFEPTDILQSLLAALMARDRPAPKILAPAALWGFIADKQKDDEEPGVTVKEVLADSAAAKAGLKAGDRLLTLDDRWTDSLADCYTATSYVKPGTEVKIVIKRDGKERELRVTPQAGL